MTKKTAVLFAAFALLASQALFAQAAAIDAAISNAARDISARVPQEARIAVLNIESDYEDFSNRVINGLIMNLVRTGQFQVVPRSTVEMEAAREELGFQMTGYVSDDAQRRLGQFLGADTIITGTVARETAATYRLVVNAIDLEAFAFQYVHAASVPLDGQIAALTSVVIRDYTVGQRFGMSALNTIFGAGSIINGHRIGWAVAGGHTLGIGLIAIASVMDPLWHSDMTSAELRRRQQRADRVGISGYVILFCSLAFGWIIPVSHTRQGAVPAGHIAAGGFPLGFELVSTNGRSINGARVMYTRRF